MLTKVKLMRAEVEVLETRLEEWEGQLERFQRHSAENCKIYLLSYCMPFNHSSLVLLAFIICLLCYDFVQQHS